MYLLKTFDTVYDGVVWNKEIYASFVLFVFCILMAFIDTKTIEYK